MREPWFYLFAYGTLMSPGVFRAVTGKDLTADPHRADGVDTFLAVQAVLDGYSKASPDKAYLYAVPDRQGRIAGQVIGPLPRELMGALRQYEGRNYSRRKVRVQTKDGPIDAIAFLANLRQLQHAFGYQFRDPLKQEILLEGKIQRAITEAQQEQLRTDEPVAGRAVGELAGPIVRDLIRQHFDAGGVSDYVIRSSLKDHPLRDFGRIASDAEARRLAPNYLAMVIRQVLFNQFEERVRKDFRYELDHMGLGKQFYERTVSSLISLRLLNAHAELVQMLVDDCLHDLELQVSHLVDYVRWAIVAADTLYHTAQARQELSFVSAHMERGFVPFGAELEFSDIGHEVIRDPTGSRLRDRRYDGFIYFSDFGLDLLTWKLGGHVDDHHRKVGPGPRRGFFEVALGSVSIKANLSKPITDDPWLLNQMIHETRRFFPIGPHSLHISLQLKTQHPPVGDRMLSLASMKCLFAMGGDLRKGQDGRWRISRLSDNEIVRRGEQPGLLFSEVSRRYSRHMEEPSGLERMGRYVQQFRFLRLSPQVNYEPIALALKGLQIARRPGTFLQADQVLRSPRHREAFEALVAWGDHPSPISAHERELFLSGVYHGLMTERRGKPAHSEAYIAWAMSDLEGMIGTFNRKVAPDAAPVRPARVRRRAPKPAAPELQPPGPG